MAFTIFYSWQSKTEQVINHYFIRDCLAEAIKQIKKKNSVSINLDYDTKGESGIPFIPEVLESKIADADIFVADLTYIDHKKKNKFQQAISDLLKIVRKQEIPKEQVSAPNVLIELGYALGNYNITSKRIITVMNTFYGVPESIPFDIKQRSFPSQYFLKPGATKDEIDIQKKALVDQFIFSIKAIQKKELERQKDFFQPFMVFQHWEKTLSTDIKFENTDYIKSLFHEIRQNINEHKTVFRVSGLSGVGKTRILFECFKHQTEGVPEEVTNKILYVDCNHHAEKTILAAIKELLLREENKIVIIDNCSIDNHNTFTGFVTNKRSKLSLITVGLNPEERIEHLDAERVSRLLIIDNVLCKQTVNQILKNNFPELDIQEIELLIDFSSGIAAIATLMAHNPERANKQPGSLQKKDILNRLLGNLYEDPHSKSVLLACSLFSKFGFFDDLATQTEMIATNEDITPIHLPHANLDDIQELKVKLFKDVCKTMYERKLLERVGRMYSLRPSPLAISMAEEWWKSCTTQKFVRILPELNKHGLIEQFCEQFQYLKHHEHAKSIVGDLCSGVFSTAEVLNTKAGSRLFRSFVNVNPKACVFALEDAFSKLNKNTIREVVHGRRNLIWALEKLCFRVETFISAAKIMALFAVGENEGISNNATNQFLQLFHIYLSGTAANLEDRWEIVEFCLGDETYIDLGVRALNQGLTAHNFNRMGGAEDQGDLSPLVDYKPSPPEIYNYWNKIIKKLLDLTSYDNYQSRVANILVDNFYSLCASGASDLIIPAVKLISSKSLIDKMELRSKLKFIINSQRILDVHVLDDLKNWYEELSPVTFIEKFKLYVQNPTSDEYFEDNDDLGDGAKLKKNINLLADEFYQHKDNWEKIIPLLVKGNLIEAFNFGISVGNQINDLNEASELIDQILIALKLNNANDRNFNFLLGLLKGLNNEPLSIKIFNKILNDPQIKNNAFLVIRSIELPYEEIIKCIEGLEAGEFDVATFSTFDYGWGLRHLSVENIFEILSRIRNHNELGKIIAYKITSKWSYGDEIMKAQFEPLLRQMIMEDSYLILANSFNTMDSYHWSIDILKFIEDGANTDIAKKAIDTIIDISNLSDKYYSSENNFIKILNILQEKHFNIFWEAIRNFYKNPHDKGYSLMHLKDLLGPVHDYSGSSDGILFKGDNNNFEIILNWCKQQEEDTIHWIALMLPIYETKVSETTNWHPYALKFINEFGNSESILSAISANLGTYSWTGSILPRLEIEMNLFKSLRNHILPSVKKWAEIQIENIEKRIISEANREQDGFLGGINY